MRLTAILPHLAGLRLQQVIVDEKSVVLVVAAKSGRASCPLCGWRSSRVHSHYERTLTDLPLQGRVVLLRVRVRRFRCVNHACVRTIFTERLPKLTVAHGRRTHGQRAALEQVGFALGGSAGVRLAQPFGLPGSRATILRLVNQPVLSEAPAPRWLGVDDWAWCRGQRYGTILIDLERHQPVDLLEDRTASSFAAWLQQHPGVEVIARDRGGIYADGARQGAPEAVQVADRWHLLANVGEMLERVLSRKHVRLREAATAVDEVVAASISSVRAPSGAGTEEPSEPRLTRAAREKAGRRARRKARYDAVCALWGQGLPVVAIAQQVGVSPKTVRRFLRAGGFPERAEPHRRRTKLAPFEAYLRQRWTEGCHNAAVLYEEIRAKGFTGAASLVRRYVGAWRAEPGRRGRSARQVHAGQPPQPPVPQPTRARSPRQAHWLPLRPEDRLLPDEQLYRTKLIEADGDIQRAHQLAEEFGKLVREQQASNLEAWLTQAEASSVIELSEFAAGLRRDRAAVQAALSLKWSNGQTEGQINRLKFLKRQTYGRASFTLLRKRMLQAA